MLLDGAVVHHAHGIDAVNLVVVRALRGRHVFLHLRRIHGRHQTRARLNISRRPCRQPHPVGFRLVGSIGVAFFGAVQIGLILFVGIQLAVNQPRQYLHRIFAPADAGQFFFLPVKPQFFLDFFG